MNHTFDHVIPRAANGDKPLAGAVYGLMVGGIYFGAVSVELVKEIMPAEVTVKIIVELVAPDPFMGLGGVDMLCDVSAEMDIYKLKPFANAEHGLFLCCKTGEDFKLKDIKFCVDMAGAVVSLSEEGGCDVASAREKKVRGGVRLTGIQTDKTGDAQSFYGVFIIFGVLGTTGDQYGGSRHGRILFAECYYILCFLG